MCIMVHHHTLPHQQLNDRSLLHDGSLQVNRCGAFNAPATCQVLHGIIYQRALQNGQAPGTCVNVQQLPSSRLHTRTRDYCNWKLNELSNGKFWSRILHVTHKEGALLHERVVSKAAPEEAESVPDCARRMQAKQRRLQSKCPMDVTMCMRVVAHALPKRYGFSRERDELVHNCNWATGLRNLYKHVAALACKQHAQALALLKLHMAMWRKCQCLSRRRLVCPLPAAAYR